MEVSPLLTSFLGPRQTPSGCTLPSSWYSLVRSRLKSLAALALALAQAERVGHRVTEKEGPELSSRRVNVARPPLAWEDAGSWCRTAIKTEGPGSPAGRPLAGSQRVCLTTLVFCSQLWGHIVEPEKVPVELAFWESRAYTSHVPVSPTCFTRSWESRASAPLPAASACVLTSPLGNRRTQHCWRLHRA